MDILALMTRDTDYRPVLVKARARGKKTMIIATDVAFSAALRNTADTVIIFKGPGNVETIVNNQVRFRQGAALIYKTYHVRLEKNFFFEVYECQNADHLMCLTGH